MRASWRWRMVAGLAAMAAVSTTAARAQDEESRPHPFQFFKRYHLNKEGKPVRGKPRDIPYTFDRAGHPQMLAERTAPSNTPNGIGYYVGGSVPFYLRHKPRFEGAHRAPDDGTWGWDETGGFHLRHRNILGYSHGLRYQGGGGAYRTDGPVVPDVIYFTSDKIQQLTTHRRPEPEEEE